MATVNLSTSPTQIDDGTSVSVLVTNTGASDVELSRGGRLRPAQSRTVYPEGTALSAAALSGTGQVSTVATAAPTSQAAQITANTAAVAANTAAIAGLPATYAGLVDTAATPKVISALRPFHGALANRTASPCDILVIGDSFTEGGGAGAVSTRDRRYVAHLRDLLRARFPVAGVTGGEGYIPTAWTVGGTFAMPAPATLTGAPAFQTSWGFGKRGHTLTTGQSVQWTVTGTSVDVHFVKGGSTGVMAVSIDGGTATTYATTSGAGTIDNGVQRVSLGSAGSHTVNVSWSSGGTVYLMGIMVYNGDESAGVRMTESGHWGWKSGDWSNNASSQLTNFAQRVTALQPSLIIVALGTNDHGSSIAPATTQANLQSIITTSQAACTIPPPVVLADWYQRQGTFTYQWSDYQAVFKALEAASPSVVHFDFSARVPAYNTDTTLVGSDLLHPSEKGHALIGATLARFLEPR